MKNKGREGEKKKSDCVGGENFNCEKKNNNDK